MRAAAGPRWPTPALAAAGLVIAGYLTLLHYDTTVPLYCSNAGAIDCAQVLTSAQSVVLGVPMAAWGLLWFGATLVLALGRAFPGRARLLRLWSAIGALTVVYLVYAELLVIGKICIWCTSVHVLVLAIFVLQQTRGAGTAAG